MQLSDTITNEKRAYEILLTHFPDYEIKETNKGFYAAIDSIIVKNDVIVAFSEIKSKPNSLSEMSSWYDNLFLVSFDKIIRGRDLSYHCKIPFYILLYLQKDDSLVVAKVTDHNGDLSVEMITRKSIVQECMNGKKINRVCSYINLTGLTAYTINSKFIIYANSTATAH